VFLETMKFTAKTLLRKPVRSLLTTLQVSLGIAAVALVLNIIMQPDATADGPSFIGADEQLIRVYNGTEFEDERGIRTVGMTSIFTAEDIQAVRTIEGVVSIPLKRDDPRDTIELDGLLYLTSGLRPVNKDLMDLADLKVIEGTVFTSMDYENQSRTLVISQQAAKALFGDESPIGKKLAFTMSLPVGMASMSTTSNSRSRFEGIREEFEVIGVVDISSGNEMPFDIRPEHFMAPLGEVRTASTDRQTRPVTDGAGPLAEPMSGSISIQPGPVTGGTSIPAGIVADSPDLVAGSVTGGVITQVGPGAGSTSDQAGPMTSGPGPQAGLASSGASVQAGAATGSTDSPAEPVTGGVSVQAGSVTASDAAQTLPVMIRNQLWAEFTMVVKKSAIDHVKRSMEEVLTSKYGSRLSLMFTEPYIPSTQGVDKTFGMFLGGFALVGLIVSSIGILSVMMVSVVERTREIGLRREIGASRFAVVFEIVTEAGLLAAAGALIGLVAAWFAAEPLAQLLMMSSTAEPQESLKRIGFAPAAASVLLSVAIGLLAGLWPAIQAARRPPVDALREPTS
jgi:ABC-type antimicrobial peptide transport system permease subunit